MKFEVVILKSAEQDLRELRTYLLKNYGRETRLDSYATIKVAINDLKTFPYSGSTPDALEQLNLAQYRQAIAGQNRIIYEVRQKTVYVHVVVDTALCRFQWKLTSTGMMGVAQSEPPGAQRQPYEYCH
jgi:toxin ParE1/3/4